MMVGRFMYSLQPYGTAICSDAFVYNVVGVFSSFLFVSISFYVFL